MCADPDGTDIDSQLVPLSQSTKDLQTTMAREGILPGLDNAAQHELVFLAHLPPVGYASYLCPSQFATACTPQAAAVQHLYSAPHLHSLHHCIPPSQ